MSEGLLQAVVIGLFTLAGVALGAVAANWQARNAAKQEREKDVLHRKWSLRDFARDRRLGVRDTRCKQAEDFVSGMSEDFHQFRVHAIWLLGLDPQGPIPAELHDYAYWQKRIDRSIFQYGPVISAISSEGHDLKIPWQVMQQAWQDMATHYAFAWATVVGQRQPIPDRAKLAEAIATVQSSYNEGLREFIVMIDRIKATRLH